MSEYITLPLIDKQGVEVDEVIVFTKLCNISRFTDKDMFCPATVLSDPTIDECTVTGKKYTNVIYETEIWCKKIINDEEIYNFRTDGANTYYGRNKEKYVVMNISSQQPIDYANKDKVCLLIKLTDLISSKMDL